MGDGRRRGSGPRREARSCRVVAAETRGWATADGVGQAPRREARPCRVRGWRSPSPGLAFGARGRAGRGARRASRARRAIGKKAGIVNLVLAGQACRRGEVEGEEPQPDGRSGEAVAVVVARHRSLQAPLQTVPREPLSGRYGVANTALELELSCGAATREASCRPSQDPATLHKHALLPRPWRTAAPRVLASSPSVRRTL